MNDRWTFTYPHLLLERVPQLALGLVIGDTGVTVVVGHWVGSVLWAEYQPEPPAGGSRE